MPTVKKVAAVRSAAKKPVSRTPDQKVTASKRVATQAINKAAIVASDQERNRSTRTRESYKIKADALDKVARILGDKE